MEWQEFFLEDVASIDKGVRLTKADMEDGITPFIGASEMNNGVTAFTSSMNESYDSNVLGVNYNGSVGFSFYHPYYAVFSDDVKRVKWLESERNNKYTLLFLSAVIKMQKDKYAYGYKFNGQRMKRQKILLPVTDDGSINWSYMEQYMRTIENNLLKQATDILCKRLIINTIQLGGVIYTLVGKNFISRMYLQKYNVANDLRKRTNLTVISHMCLQQPLITALMDSLEIMAA
jgi:hypothetical protein